MEIRNIVICLIERNNKLFVAEGVDEVKGETFYRPLGGGIEFGELAAETAVREFQEELSAEIEVISYLNTFENIFLFNGKPGHQIVMLYSAKFLDESFYKDQDYPCNEEGVEFIAKWVDKSELIEGKKILYPQGLPEYLANVNKTL